VQDLSAVFQVEVFFAAGGKVSFDPSEQKLMQILGQALDTAIERLEKMPRLLRAPALRPNLQRSGVNIAALFSDGPDFHKMTECSNLLDSVRSNIMTTIHSSFEGAEAYAEVFN
jgi:hypothetical protein